MPHFNDFGKKRIERREEKRPKTLKHKPKTDTQYSVDLDFVYVWHWKLEVKRKSEKEKKKTRKNEIQSIPFVTNFVLLHFTQRARTNTHNSARTNFSFRFISAMATSSILFSFSSFFRRLNVLRRARLPSIRLRIDFSFCHSNWTVSREWRKTNHTKTEINHQYWCVSLCIWVNAAKDNNLMRHQENSSHTSNVRALFIVLGAGNDIFNRRTIRSKEKHYIFFLFRSLFGWVGRFSSPFPFHSFFVSTKIVRESTSTSKGPPNHIMV